MFATKNHLPETCGVNGVAASAAMFATKNHLPETQNKKLYHIKLSWESMSHAQGKTDENVLSCYDNFVSKALKKNNNVVLVLSTDAMPEWLKKRGGWENRRSADEFVRYATTCIEYFGERVTQWEILNVIHEEIAHISTMTLSVATTGGDTAGALKSAYFQTVAIARSISFAHAFNNDITVRSVILSTRNTKGAFIPLIRRIQRSGKIPEGIEYMIAIRGLGFRIRYEDKLDLAMGIPDETA